MGLFQRWKNKVVSLFSEPPSNAGRKKNSTSPNLTPKTQPQAQGRQPQGREGGTKRNKQHDNESRAGGVPTHKDGTFYNFEMVCDGGRVRVYGDTAEDMLSYLIEDYQNMTKREKVMARVRHASDVKIELQIYINKFFRKAKKNKFEQIVLYNPQRQQPLIAEWFSEIPLVLVDAFYSPYSHIVAPEGKFEPHENIWWLTPVEGELDYLISLHETSYIDIYKRNA